MRIQHSKFLILNSEGFAFDVSEVESAVIPHKIEHRIERLLDEAGLIANNCYPDHCNALAVLMVDFGYRDIEPALEPADKALDDTPLALEARHTNQR